MTATRGSTAPVSRDRRTIPTSGPGAVYVPLRDREDPR